MKHAKNKIVALYMLSAYSSNLLDLIDTIEKEMKAEFRHDIKRACKSFYTAISNNKMLNRLLDEMFKVDSLEYNQYRDEVEKTIIAVLEHSPREFVKLKYIREVLEDDGEILFTEKEIQEFAINHKASAEISVAQNLENYVKNKAHFGKMRQAIHSSKIEKS